MKNITYFLVIVLVLISVDVYGQNRDGAKEMNKLIDQARYLEAKQAINDREFVFEASSNITTEGETHQVNAKSDFFAVWDQVGYLQFTTFDLMLEGLPITSYKVSENKRGNLTLRIGFLSSTGPINILMTMNTGGNYGMLQVMVSQPARRTDYTGLVLPSAKSQINKEWYKVNRGK